MATGAAYKGSDLVSDYNCSKCEIFDLNVEAQHFCSECEHYLCDNCVKSHNEYHRKHTVYKREDIPKWAGVTIDRCDQHGKKLEYNCNVHQELCCYRCREHNHGRCSSFSRLPDLAKDFLKTEEYKQLPAAVDKLRCSLDELKNDRMNNEALLNDTYKKTLAEVKTLRKKINNILDQLEKTTVEQLDRLTKDLVTDVKEDIKACAQMNDQMTAMIEKVQQMTGKHKEIHSYLGYRRCQDKLTKAEEQVQKMQRKLKQKIIFKSDIGLQQILGNLHVLGSIDKIEIEHVYNVVALKQYDVGIETDKYSSCIVGICELPSGDLVIADKINRRVNVLNRQFDITASCDLPYTPYDLCHISGNEVAVAVNVPFIRHEVCFINVTRGKLQKVRKLKLFFPCISIAHHQGQLYVSSRISLFQVSMDGKKQTEIYSVRSSGKTVRKVVVSPDGERIYFTSYNEHQLITLNKTGNVLSSFADTELIFPTGLCISPLGHVIVCGFNSVIQVDKKGKRKLATLVRKSDGLSNPQSLCFSEQTSSILVGNDHITSVCIQLTSGV